jgi:isoleucyl-tRNA synthetase
MAAYYTLYQCLTTLSKLLAPLAPFIDEELYQNLVRSVNTAAVESVHLCDFPVADKAAVDEKLIEQVKAVIAVCSLGRAARAKAGIKIRQPLAKVVVNAKSEQQRAGIIKLKHQILEELNIKDIEYIKDLNIFVKESETGRYSMLQEGDFYVAIDTSLTEELKGEGLAREIVRRLQVMRKAAELEIADHITVYYEGNAEINKIIMFFGDYIRQETLANEILEGVPSDGVYREKHRLFSSDVILGIKKIPF